MRRRTALGVIGLVVLTVIGVGAGLSVAAGDDQKPSSSVPPRVGLADHIGGVSGLVAETEKGAATDDGSDAEQPITGPDLERAAAVALAYTKGGRVTETEVGDEESYYEVEVTLEDGRQVDVQLDEGFNVVGAESDLGDD